MSEALDEMFLFGEEKMEKAIAQLKKEFASVRTGRANPGILDKVIVEYYGAPTPIRQMAQVSVSEGTPLVITPFDKSILKIHLEQAHLTRCRDVIQAPRLGQRLHHSLAYLAAHHVLAGDKPALLTHGGEVLRGA